VLKAEGVEMLPQLSNLRLDRNHKLAFSFLPSVETMNMLTSLRQLSITGGNENATLPNGLEGIPPLQYLSLSDFPSLVTLPDWLGTMTSLQTLQIHDCPKLSSLPASFKGLINLHELCISGCCPKLEKRCKKETGEEWHKIAHVPKLDIISTYESKPSFYGNLMNSFPFLLYI
jgi:Leucine-rich repeat (LRR) protein